MDDSWFQATTTTHDINVIKIQTQNKDDADYYKNIKYNDHHETPLLLATARGIIEMVETIVKTDPQSMDYVTSQNRNILHMAILHRQEKIFNWLGSQKIVMDRLGKRIDLMGFTLLHQVGIIQYLQQHQY